MSWTPFIGAVFVCNVLIGNFCLINTVDRASTPPLQDKILMSKNDPTKCPWVTQSTGPVDNAAQAAEESPCATGNCYAQPNPHTEDKAIALQELPSAALPVSPCPNLFHHTKTEILLFTHVHGPPIPIDIATIVMTI